MGLRMRLIYMIPFRWDSFGAFLRLVCRTRLGYQTFYGPDVLCKYLIELLYGIFPGGSNLSLIASRYISVSDCVFFLLELLATIEFRLLLLAREGEGGREADW